MSKILRDKLYLHEQPPPPAAWDKIAEALEEAQLSDSFPKKLYETGVEPPLSAWQTIEASLSSSENAVLKYPTTLYNLEVAPPPTSWEQIIARLDNNTGERVIPLLSRPLFRYAVAAVVIGLIAFFGVRLLNTDSDETNNLANNSATQVGKKIRTSSDKWSLITYPLNDMQSSDQRNDEALEASKATFAKLDTRDSKRFRNVDPEHIIAPAYTISSFDQLALEKTYRDPDCREVAPAVYMYGSTHSELANRYAILMTPDGNIIRISRKLGDLVCCVSGEDTGNGCVDQLKKWRQRMADSPVATSPGNFMDILNLVNTLKDTGL